MKISSASPFIQKRTCQSFSAMKKSQFDGLDFFIVERYKAPIEKFDSHKDYQSWADVLYRQVENRRFGGRTFESVEPRKNIIEDWVKCLNSDLYCADTYAPAQKMFILDGVTSELKPSNDKLPPVLNRVVLEQTINYLDSLVRQNRKAKFSFNEEYQSRLKDYFLKECGVDSDYTGWIKIPSKKNDAKNFDKNVDKLKAFSCKTWCTKTYTAFDYLLRTDLAIYLEKGQPKLALRLVGSKIEDIQGERNDSRIPMKYLPVFEKYKKENKCRLVLDAAENYKKALVLKKDLDKIKKDLAPYLKLETIEDAECVLGYFEPYTFKNQNDFLTIFDYTAGSKDFTYDDLGVDQNKLFSYISQVLGCANLRATPITKLMNLKLCGKLDLQGTKVQDLGALEECGSIILNNCPLKSLGNLKVIKSDVDFGWSSVTNLGKLEVVNGRIFIENSKLKIEDFKNIKHKGIYDNPRSNKLLVPATFV